MRHAALGVFGAYIPGEQLDMFTRADCDLSHPHKVCKDASSLFTRAIAHAVRTGPAPLDLCDDIDRWVANAWDLHEDVAKAVQQSAYEQMDAVKKRGYVLVALQNTLYQLGRTASFEEALVNIVMQGGDTDSNAAVCGALLGAVYGESNIPKEWIEVVMACKPRFNVPVYKVARPDVYWPQNIVRLAPRLVEAGMAYGGKRAYD